MKTTRSSILWLEVLARTNISISYLTIRQLTGLGGGGGLRGGLRGGNGIFCLGSLEFWDWGTGGGGGKLDPVGGLGGVR